MLCRTLALLSVPGAPANLESRVAMAMAQPKWSTKVANQKVEKIRRLPFSSIQLPIKAHVATCLSKSWLGPAKDVDTIARSYLEYFGMLLSFEIC